jgi:SAM-dependent methyltransferase
MDAAQADRAKTDAFASKVLGDGAGTFAVMACGIGDRHGLFKALDEHGPQTSVALAKRTGLSERYLREWASLLTCARYLTHDPSTGRFSLPPEHAEVLAREGGSDFLGGVLQQFGGLMQVYEPVAAAFRDGKGVAAERYGEDVWKGEQRGNDMWHENLLVHAWVPLMPKVKARLEGGARVADFGSGGGKAMVRLGQAFPKSTFVGFDIHAPSVERANALAKAEGVADRVRFEVSDLTKGVPGSYDIITAFDVVHDTAHPSRVFEHVRRALAPGGTFVLLEVNGAPTLEGNIGPLGALFYGWSTFFCMSIAIGRGGEGLGTAGLHEAVVRDYAQRAGFSAVRRVELNSPFNALFEVVA